MTRPTPSQAAPGEWVVLIVVSMLAAVVIPVWLTVELAALVHTGSWPHVGLTPLVRGAGGWPHHLGDPARGFPRRLRRQLPGPVAFYVSAASVLSSAGLLALVGTKMAARWRGASRGYAAGAEIKAHMSAAAVRRRARQTRPSLTGRIRPEQVGLSLGRDCRTGQRLWGSVEDSYLYLGPPRSGKGVHLVIPQTLDAPGAVVVTATRPDTLRHTLALRRSKGPVVVFDPQNLAGDVPRLRWSPQRGCADPLIAITRARALAAGSHLSSGSTTNGDFWQSMTEAVIRCYLHTAALCELPVSDVVGWAARPTDPTPVRLLRAHPDAAPGWADELAAQVGSDARQRNTVWAGVRRSIDSLADPRVLSTCSPAQGEQFDPTAFLRDGGTLYLLGSTGAQLSVAPLITALVEDIVDAARRLAAASPGGRLDPPLLVMLDEAANIAPLPSLPSLLADGGGVGITTVAVLQSLAQARARWGEQAADALWDAATNKVVLGGLAHADDLAKVSRLAGDIDEATRTLSAGDGGRSASTAMRRLPALPIETLRCLPPGRAIVLARHTPPVNSRLLPWWERPDAEQIRLSAAVQP